MTQIIWELQPEESAKAGLLSVGIDHEHGDADHTSRTTLKIEGLTSAFLADEGIMLTNVLEELDSALDNVCNDCATGDPDDLAQQVYDHMNDVLGVKVYINLEYDAIFDDHVARPSISADRVEYVDDYGRMNKVVRTYK